MYRGQIPLINDLKYKKELSPSVEEIVIDDDPMLQQLWRKFKESVSYATRKNLSIAQDHRSRELWKLVEKRFYVLQEFRQKNTDASSKKDALSSPVLPALRETQFSSSSVLPWMSHQHEEDNQHEKHFQPKPPQEEGKVIFIP